MVLTIDQRLRRRWRALPGDWPARALIALLTLVLTVQLVRLLYAIITPAAPLGDWQPRATQELPPAARAALFARFDPFYRNIAAASAGSSEVTTLQIQLYGVRVDAGGQSSAIIAGTDGVQKSIGTGEEIQPGVRLAAVMFDHVEIDNGGRRELLYLDQSQAAGGRPGNSSGAMLLPAPGSGAGVTTPAPPATNPIGPAAIRAGVSFTPRTDNGRVTGIAVGQQGDGASFRALGLRTGDVIRSINGRPINGAGDVATLGSQIQPGARITIEVERGAGTVPLTISIPQGNP